MGHGPTDQHGDSSEWRQAVLGKLASLNSEAVELFATGRFKQAISVFEDTRDECHAQLGPDHAITLTVAGNLAATYAAAGRRREGIAALSASVADRVRILGDEAPETLTARDALATAYRLAGDVDEAVRLAELVTVQRSRRLGPADPDTITSRMGLIRAVAAAGDVSTALGYLTSALQDAEQTLGAHHGHTRAVLECGQGCGLLHRNA